jgi:trehalose synthase
MTQASTVAMSGRGETVPSVPLTGVAVIRSMPHSAADDYVCASAACDARRVELEDVPITPLRLERFESVLDAEGAARLADTLARGRELLADRTIWSVNSTARGGGVAEMLRSLIGYVQGAGVDARWVVVPGDPAFFDVTKRLHNRLHGVDDGVPLDRELYERRCEQNAAELARRVRARDVVLLHDPQTAGMVPRMLETGAPVIWRAHIGLDMPNEAAREAWRFLIPFVEAAHAFVFSRLAYAWEGLDRGRITVIPPSIDAFSPKNQAMSFTGITAVLRAAGLAADHHERSRAVFERLDGTVGRVERRARITEEHALRLDAPLVAQVSRWDRLKDPIGVLTGFAEHVRSAESAHLVLAGPDVEAVADDPEGAAVLADVDAAWRELPRDVRRRVHLVLLPMEDPDENAIIVNALQRRADVVVQKSLAEGFGLTVSEAMWKGRPVVASAVGGIEDQIEDGKSGCLVPPDDLAEFGRRVSTLLEDPHGAERMGAAAQARVRGHFLGPRHLAQYVDLLTRVLDG